MLIVYLRSLKICMERDREYRVYGSEYSLLCIRYSRGNSTYSGEVRTAAMAAHPRINLLMRAGRFKCAIMAHFRKEAPYVYESIKGAIHTIFFDYLFFSIPNTYSSIRSIRWACSIGCRHSCTLHRVCGADDYNSGGRYFRFSCLKISHYR